jgi:Fic family protein
MLAAVLETAQWTTGKIIAIRDLMGRAAEHVRAAAPNMYSREMIELIFMQPYCRISNVTDAGLAKRQTASEYLKRLTSIGVLSELKAGREKLFIHPALVRPLTTDDNIVMPYSRLSAVAPAA